MKLQLPFYIFITLSILLQLCLCSPRPSGRRDRHNARAKMDIRDPNNYYLMSLKNTFSHYLDPKIELKFEEATTFLVRLQLEVWKLHIEGKKLQSDLKQVFYDNAQKEMMGQKVSDDISSRMDSIAILFKAFMKLKEQMDKDMPMITERLQLDLKRVLKHKVSTYMTVSKESSLLIQNQIFGFRKYKIKQDKANLKKLRKEFTHRSDLLQTLISSLESIYTNKFAFELIREVFFKVGVPLMKRMEKEEKMPTKLLDWLKKSRTLMQKVWREVSGGGPSYHTPRDIKIDLLLKAGEISSDNTFHQLLQELQANNIDLSFDLDVLDIFKNVQEFSLDFSDIAKDLIELIPNDLECVNAVAGCIDGLFSVWELIRLIIELPFRICGQCMDLLDD